MTMLKKVVDAVTELTVLNRKKREIEKRMEELKGVIRPWAREKWLQDRVGNPDLTMIEIPSSQGTCSVIFPRDSADIVAGTSPSIIKPKLPAEKWNLLFTETVVLSSGFRDSWLAAQNTFSKAERNLVLKVVTFKEATPRVETAK